MNEGEFRMQLDRLKALYGGSTAQYEALGIELARIFGPMNSTVFRNVVDSVVANRSAKGTPTVKEFLDSARDVQAEKNVPGADVCHGCDGFSLIPAKARNKETGKIFDAMLPCMACNRYAAEKIEMSPRYEVIGDSPVPRTNRMTSEESLAWCIDEASKLTPKGARKVLSLAEELNKSFPAPVLEVIQAAAARA